MSKPKPNHPNHDSHPHHDLLGALFTGKVEIDPEDYLKALKNRPDMLESFKDDWLEKRDPSALITIVMYCYYWDEILPLWASVGVVEVIAKEGERRSRRRDRDHGWHRAKDLNFLRWWKVEDLRKLSTDEFERQFGQKKTLDNIWRIVAKQVTAEEGVTVIVCSATAVTKTASNHVPCKLLKHASYGLDLQHHEVQTCFQLSYASVT
jgi:hypothetical protein